MTHPKVSFVIPALNAERTINLCLESIQSLDHPSELIEIIVMDNGSIDRTREIAMKFTSKVFMDPKSTIGGLRNQGAREATGEFLAFIDSDIVLPKDWFKTALRHFQDDAIGMLGTHSYCVPETESWVERAWKVHLDSRDRLEQRSVDWVTTRALIVRKVLFDAVSGFDPSLVTAEDVDLGRKVHEHSKILSVRKMIPLHLGGVHGLVDFFKKEVWRNQDNRKASLRGIWSIKEVVWFLIMGYYLAALLFLLVAIALFLLKFDVRYVLIACLALFLPLAVGSWHACSATGQYRYFSKLILVYGAYLLARLKAYLVWKK